MSKTIGRPKLVTRLVTAFAGNGEITVRPGIRVGEGERVVGILADPALRSLYQLLTDLTYEVKAVVPNEKPRGPVELAQLVEKGIHRKGL